MRPFIPPIPSDSGGSRPRDEEDTSNTGSSGNTGNTGNTGSSNTGNVPDRDPPPPPAFDDGRGGSVDVTPPPPPNYGVNGPVIGKNDMPLGEDDFSFADQFGANVIEDIVITTYEAVGTGLAKLTEAMHFSSYVDDIVELNSRAFTAAGIGIDFVGQLQDGNNIVGSAILAAGHFATFKAVELSLVIMIPAIAPYTLLLYAVSVIVASFIITYFDRYGII